jgi:hypothetical protein
MPLSRGAGEQPISHAWPCSGWGLPSRSGRPDRWCALTAPFHPYLCGPEGPPSAVCFLWHFPASHPDWPLASTLLCGVPTFLNTIPQNGPGCGHLADSPSPPVCHQCRGAGGAHRLGRVSVMSSGAHQLFDPESPPLAVADAPTEGEGRAGLLSIGALYDEVSAACTSS